MTRVCLECGTPKRDSSEVCKVCKQATYTHDGAARKSLCNRCQFQKVFGDEGQFYCGFTNVNLKNRHLQPGVKGSLHRGLNHSVDRFLDFTVDYKYACQDFKQAYSKPTVPSSNPVQGQELRDLRQYYENPLAFWLAPKRWDHVEDPRKQMFWVEPPKPPSKLKKVAMVAGLLGIAVAGFRKVDKKPDNLALESNGQAT